MAKYGVWMLERLSVVYSRSGGSSRGMRAWLQEMLPAFSKENPHLGISVEGRETVYLHPMVYANYRSGRSKPVCVKNLAAEEIMERVRGLRDSHGRGQEYKVVRKRQLSRNPSIQGPWTANTFAPQLQEEMAKRKQAQQVTW